MSKAILVVLYDPQGKAIAESQSTAEFQNVIPDSVGEMRMLFDCQKFN
jgi:hypothetical protein